MLFRSDCEQHEGHGTFVRGGGIAGQESGEVEMLVREYKKTREELLLRKKSIDADISTRRTNLLAALSLTRPNSSLQGEYIMSMAINLNELLIELKGVDDHAHDILALQARIGPRKRKSGKKVCPARGNVRVNRLLAQEQFFTCFPVFLDQHFYLP